MILTPLPLDNPWKRSAIVFFMFNTMSVVMVWIVFDIKGISNEETEQIFLLNPVVSIAIFFLGIFLPASTRVVSFVLILGIFGLFPILLFSMLPIFSYLLVSSSSSTVSTSVIFCYLAIALLWILIKFRATAVMENKFNYLESHIYNCGLLKFLDRSNLMEFSALEKKPKRKYRFMKSLIIPLSCAGYPLQKLLTSIGGESAVLLFLSIMCAPLSIYFMGRIASGYYLWIYSVRRYEKVHNTKLFMKVNV